MTILPQIKISDVTSLLNGMEMKSSEFIYLSFFVVFVSGNLFFVQEVEKFKILVILWFFEMYFIYGCES